MRSVLSHSAIQSGRLSVLRGSSLACTVQAPVSAQVAHERATCFRSASRARKIRTPALLAEMPRFPEILDRLRRPPFVARRRKTGLGVAGGRRTGARDLASSSPPSVVTLVRPRIVEATVRHRLATLVVARRSEGHDRTTRPPNPDSSPQSRLRTKASWTISSAIARLPTRRSTYRRNSRWFPPTNRRPPGSRWQGSAVSDRPCPQSRLSHPSYLETL